MPDGTRRAHTRNGKPVRSTGIAPPRARPQLVRGHKRYRHRPALYAAGALAVTGALTAVLSGRWFTAAALVGVGLLLFSAHLGWQRHQNRQASKPRVQRREALEKAREAHQPEPAEAESVRKQPSELNRTNGVPPAKPAGEPASHHEWQTRYGKRCDCANCRAQRKAERAEKAALR